MSSALEVTGNLEVLADGRPLRVEFRGDVVAVELPDVRAALALRRRFPRRERRRRLGLLQSALSRAGLRLQIWVGRHQVGRLATGTRRRWSAVLLGLDPLEMNVGPLLALLAGRNRPGRGPDQSDARTEAPR